MMLIFCKCIEFTIRYVFPLVPYAPTSIMFGPDCPDLEFVNVFWQVRFWHVVNLMCLKTNCTTSACTIEPHQLAQNPLIHSLF